MDFKLSVFSEPGAMSDGKFQVKIKKRIVGSSAATEIETESSVNKRMKHDTRNKRDNWGSSLTKAHAFYNAPILEKIMSYVFSDLKQYRSLTLVCKDWKQLTNQSSSLWWPLVQKLLLSCERQCIDHNRGYNFDYLHFMIQHLIPKQPSLFSSSGPKSSWKDQYKTLQSCHSPRPVWVDVQDGHAFIPTAGWFNYWYVCLYVTLYNVMCLYWCDL